MTPPDAALADLAPNASSAKLGRGLRLWTPKRVLLTASARGWEHGRAMAERCAALGADVTELPSDRLPLQFGDEPRRAYADAKNTLAITVASAAKRRLQPIAPSADWRVDLAEGCPAHCHYCYLAGSLKGPPITRAYANLPEILAEIPPRVGQGTVTSRQELRAHEGTTFEASCYTDPLGIEHLTGSLSALIEWFGRAGDAAGASLRFTTKFAAVDPLLPLDHGRRTRMRVSVNASRFQRFEGGTSPIAQRLLAARRVALAGYPVGLTVAPIMAAEGWREGYDGLFAEAAAALREVPGLDLTAELITHRFTPNSKGVLSSWYPGTSLEMDEEQRSEKRTKFGSVKHVYPKDVMKELRSHIEERLEHHIPGTRVLYWT